MKFQTLFCIVLMSFGLIGCATSSPQACNSSSSYVSTFNGSADYTPMTADSCSVEGSPATASSASAYAESACSFKQGLFAGEHGMYPDGQCDQSSWDDYETGYSMGRKVFEANGRLEIVSEALETSRKRLWTLESNADGIGQAAEVARVKANIEALIQVRDLESRRLHNLHADNTH